MVPTSRPRRSVTVAGTALGFCAALALTSCTPPVQTARAENATILLGDGFDTLDPTLAYAAPSITLSRFLYDTLLHRDESTQEMHAGVAESWKMTPTHASFTLRNDVTCSDGTPVTAKTVARTFERAKDPALNAPLTAVYFGSTDYTVRYDEAARTVDVDLTVPSPFLERAFGNGPAIICDAALDNPATLTKTSAGSGPYVLTEAVQGDHYTLKMRDDYTWGPDGAKTQGSGMPSTITFKVVTDPNTQTNLLLGGDANAMIATPEALPRFEGVPDLTTKVASLETGDVVFNQREGLVGADPAVRKALVQAINRQELTTVQTAGTGIVPNSLRGENEVCTDAKATAPLIPDGGQDAANSTLKGGGWAKNADGIYEKNGKPLEIRLMKAALTKEGAEYVQDVWTKLGVKVKVDTRPVAQVMGILFAGTEWDATISIVSSDSPLPFAGLFGGPASPKGGNFAAIQNTAFSDASRQARASTADESCSHFLSAEQALLERVDVTPVFASTSKWVFKGMDAANLNVYLIPTSLRMK
ncbi:ABC transporter substrate-binding protein [Paenarthrobacter sp. NPDC056912]|uniref:ABC transporter substrate-binding protein n=1 Tax=Paenarthrobacter sp. NPDC056912 TaxID=3345965 RepID=UPI00367210A7